MVAQFFVVNVANNYALNFNIPMPLHLIFRSVSMMSNAPFFPALSIVSSSQSKKNRIVVGGGSAATTFHKN